MRRYYVLSAVGTDRPGIVAEVSQVIFEAGCNLEDSRMALLGNQFALMILAAADDDATARRFEERCAQLGRREGDVRISLFPVEGEAAGLPPELPAPNYEIRVVGLDRAGIVFRTSKLLAAHGINIGEMETRVDPAAESGSPIFTLQAELTVPGEVDVKALRRELEALADELHVEISLSPAGPRFR
ncbi:MAG: amino acid-binding protein [Deferrisomatales bacterium]